MIEARGPNKVGVPLEESKARIVGAMAGMRPPTIGEKIASTATSFWHKATRQFEHLASGTHGALKFALNKMSASRSYANGEAQRLIDGLIGKMTDAERKVFAEKVMANDFFQDLQRGKQIPFDFEENNFLKWKKDTDAASPHLNAAVEADKKIVNGLVDTLVKEAKAVGVDLSFLEKNPDYFRHQVLSKMREKMGLEAGERMPIPGIKGSLKERAGTGLDINAHYAQSRFETIQNLIKDAEWFRLQRTIKETEDIGAKYLLEARRTGKRLEDIIPEGYVVRDYVGQKYQRFKDPVGSAMNDALESAVGPELSSRAMGADPMVLPKEVAKTVDEFFTAQAAKPGLFAKGTGAWKWWRLNNPKTAPMYHIRNTTGDIEAVLNHPVAFGEARSAYNELMDVVVRGKSPSPEMAEWMRRGGFSTYERIQEMAQLGKIKEFQQVASKEGFLDQAMRAGTAPFRKYKDALDKFGDVREGILRYADYKATLKELEDAGGVFKTHGQYGASLKSEVDAIKDIRDKAFKISNERMGAYDTMTVFGKKLRETIFPFWSWKEANAKRTYGILRNAMRDGRAGGIAASLGKAAGAKTVGGAVAVGRTMVKLAIPTALYTAYNKTVMGDVEKDLPEYIRNRPHINIGRNSDGSARYIDGIGAMGDLLAWAGVDTNSGKIKDWIDGKGSLMDVVKGVLKAPVNVMAQSINPAIKAPVVVATGKDFYPDAFKPRQIRDTVKYLFDQVALGEEYSALTNKPQEGGYGGTWKKLLFKTIDPGAGAYNESMSLMGKYLDKVGKNKEAGAYTDEQNYLYYAKLAMRYGDGEKATYWMNKYYSKGGSPDGLNKSLKAMEPGYRIPKDYRDDFYNTMSAEEREMWGRAMRYYEEIISGKKMSEEEMASNAEKNGVEEFVRKPDTKPAISVPAKKGYSKKAADILKRRGK